MSFTDRLSAALEPWMTDDLQTLVNAVGAMYEPVESLVADVGIDGEVGYQAGWSTVFDPDLCPAAQLPYLAQFVGAVIPTGADEAVARAVVKAENNLTRGTPTAIAGAVRRTLSNPNGTVVFNERSASACPSQPAYGLVVGVLASECPSSTATLAAINAVKPAGIIVDLIVSDAPTIDVATRTINGAVATAVIDTAVLSDVT